MADALVPILELWQRSFLVMDEVDVLLHPLRSELNFPIGAKVPIDLGAQRWNLPFFLLDCLVATDTESRRQQQQQQAAAAAASGFAAAGAVKSNEEEESTFLPTEAAALLTTPAHASATQEDAKAASSSSQGMEVDTNVGGAGSDEKGSASANMAVKEAAVKAALQELKEAIADG